MRLRITVSEHGTRWSEYIIVWLIIITFITFIDLLHFNTTVVYLFNFTQFLNKILFKYKFPHLLLLFIM